MDITKYKFEETMDSKSGRVERHYTYNGFPCLRILMESHLCKQLAGYTLIEKDLRSAAVWLEEIQALRNYEDVPKGYTRSPDRKTYNVIKGLFVAALTFYGKCFSSCKGRNVKLEQQQLDEKYRIAHDKLINARHNFAAHSGADQIEYVEIALVLPRAKEVLAPPNLYRELFQPDLMSTGIDDISFADVVQHAREIVLKKINMLNVKIMKEEVYPKGRDFWLKNTE